jgi:phage terminase large subunit-like protein
MSAVVSYAVRARRYAAAVCAGKIPACRWVRLACKRHLADLAAQKRRDFAYRFDAAAAAKVCAFLELLPHVKGHWAIPQSGRPKASRLRLEDWQCFFVCTGWGWKEKGTGLRRFRVVVLVVPRKNAKSTIAAGLGLYHLTADGEFGPEIYSGATSEKQAWEVFRPAKQMAERTPAFVGAYGVTVNAKSLAVVATGGRFEPVIGKPGDGASPSLAIVDEYHEHPDPTLYDTMATGMGARRQPLMLVITTAGEDIAGPCYALVDRIQKMLDGTQPDDRLFGLTYTIDDDTDWTSDAALRMANPNMGVSVSAEFLREAQKAALNSSRDQSVFKTKHLDVWVTARDAWMNMEWWNRQADPALRVESFAGEPCWVAVDLSAKLDLTATMRVFRREVDGTPHYYAFGRYYVPLASVEDPRNRHYQGWVKDGHLIGTEGDVTDFSRIRNDLRADHDVTPVTELAFDPWGATQLAQELAAEGLTVIEIPQVVKHLSDPMKMVEALTKSGQLHHDGNPCLAWQMSNVTCREDANGNVFPRKGLRENKIDGAVALIMALGRALLGQSAASIYDTPERAEGLLVL